MAEPLPAVLFGRTILVIEDDYFLAQDIARKVRGSGASILGPVSNVHDALEILKGAISIDAAILDINLMGEMAYPIADALRARSTPFLFVTGYDTAQMPPDYRDVTCCQKPVETQAIANALLGLAMPDHPAIVETPGARGP